MVPGFQENSLERKREHVEYIRRGKREPEDRGKIGNPSHDLLQLVARRQVYYLRSSGDDDG